MPVAPFTAPPLAGRPPAPAWTSLLFQGVGAAGWHLHRKPIPGTDSARLTGQDRPQLTSCRKTGLENFLSEVGRLQFIRFTVTDVGRLSLQLQAVDKLAQPPALCLQDKQHRVVAAMVGSMRRRHRRRRRARAALCVTGMGAPRRPANSIRPPTDTQQAALRPPVSGDRIPHHARSSSSVTTVADPPVPRNRPSQ